MIGFLLIVVLPLAVLGAVSWFVYRRPSRGAFDTSVGPDTSGKHSNDPISQYFGGGGGGFGA